MNSTRNCLADADAILVGTGAGLSAAAGIHYSGPDFQAFFAPFIKKYGFTDLYTSSFYDFATEEERWAYWAAHVMYSRIMPPAMPLYRELYDLVKAKPHFVITTNVDGQHRKAGFAAEDLFEVQGDYAYIQRADGADGRRTDATERFKRMYAQTRDCRIPSELVPHAEDGSRMDINIRKDSCFVEDDDWRAAADRYVAFLETYKDSRLLLLELGVGFNTPTIIRHPFEQLAAKLSNATLIRINRDYPQCQLPVKRFHGLTTLDVATLRSLGLLE